MTVYGIKNCDTIKKALSWLLANNISYDFFDFKKEKLDSDVIGQWLEHVDNDKLLNRRSTSWRQLSEIQKTANDRDSLISLIIETPTLIKRPLVEYNGEWSVGFNETEWQQRFT